MAIDLNTDPYFDDYSEDKKFYRILFKPGYAVQARELNQLQTILQKQISRFGSHIFKNGSLVIPGNTYYDKNFNYVKLTTSYNSIPTDSYIQDLVGREVTGQTSNVKAIVQTVIASENSDPPTLYVKYISSGNSTANTVFDASEAIITSDTGTSYGVQVASTAPTGKAHGVKIDRGVYFVRDNFALVTAQTLVLDKYSATPTYKVGLTVTETFKTSDDDSSLLDPALGSYNYFAPGADRLFIDLTLDKRDVAVSTETDDFIELLRVENGQLVTLVNKPGYNLLQDELARRTFDESGDYTVEPFTLSYIEHLKDDQNYDGYLTAANGGDGSKGIAVLGPGKSYVKGYEVSTIFNKYLIFNKPRDNTFVDNARVVTPIGNYVLTQNTYSIPNFTSNYTNIELYNRYKATPSSPAGTLVGNAKVIGYEVDTGNVMLPGSTFKNYMFDVQMKKGYSFERDAKMMYMAAVSDTGYSSPLYAADITPSYTTLTGVVTVTNGSTALTGVNTLFNSELKVDDYITFSTSGNVAYRVATITNNISLTLDRNYVGTTTSGVTFTRNEAAINDVVNSSLVFEFPQQVVKSISDIDYKTRRAIPVVLNSGGAGTGNAAVQLTAVGEEFDTWTSSRYYAVVTSGTRAGNTFTLSSAQVSFPNAPSDYTLAHFKLYDYGFTTESAIIYSTIFKSNPSVKTKTSATTSLDYTTETDCRATVISLGKADVYELVNVQMSANVFGSSFSSTSATDITNRYTLDTNQTAMFYGVSRIKLKNGVPEPTGPIRINFKYYSHSTGDYFSANSYPDYENIPAFVNQGRTYQLRDCLDFRPRIADSGANFKDTGAVRSEFLDHTNNFQCNFDYYLPRKDKIYVNSKGEFTYKEGVSSLEPVEPTTPRDAMALYVIEHPAYGFDIRKDSTFIPVDQKRYTMRDIGKLDTRIKNLEYYTTLSLLELDTALFTVKDTFGLDRFKNGFIVDSFKGHGVGDVYNPDYKIAMDFTTGELRPSYLQINNRLDEVSDTAASRTSNGYVRVGTTAVLEYQEVLLLENEYASGTESVNPFDTFTFVGTMTLDPPGDVYFQTTQKPLVYVNNNGEYDSLIPDAVGEVVYGTVWNSWKRFWYQSTPADASQPIPEGYVITDESNASERSSAILPFVRAVNINFEAKKLKPKTKYYAFFGGYDVTSSCRMTGRTSYDYTSNIGYLSFAQDELVQWGELISDETGAITGTFNFTPTDTFRIPAGLVVFRLTDSSTNAENKESLAEAVFVANGTLQKESPQTTNYDTGVNLVGTNTENTTNPETPTAYNPGLADYIALVAGGFAVGSEDGIRITQILKDSILSSVDEAAAIAYSPATFSGYSTIQQPSTVAPIELTDYNGNQITYVPPAYRDGTDSTKDFYLVGRPDGSAGPALNVMTSTNSAGQSLVSVVEQNVKSAAPSAAAGEAAWNHVVDVYNGVVESINAITAEVNRAAAAGETPAVTYTQDQRDFFIAGVEQGLWTGDAAGIAAATSQYAAAATLGYIEGGATAAAGAAASYGY